MKILLVESFHKGSHRAWAEGLARHSELEIQILSLDHLSWQNSMLYGGAALRAKVDFVPDVVVCSSTVDASAFRDLAPVITYFHENQFAYPWSENFENIDFRTKAFSSVNIRSALASRKLLFNSRYNLETFFSGAFETFSGLALDTDMLRRLQAEALVLPVGIQPITAREAREAKLLWNHRWEYDKGVKEFAAFARKTGSEVCILGESQEVVPEEFREFNPRGFVSSRTEYEKEVSKCLLQPVFSTQEFFGVSVMEAASAGVLPLLPKRLSYVELVPESLAEVVFYESEEDLIQRTRFYLDHPQKVLELEPELVSWANGYSWPNLIKRYEAAFLVKPSI